MSSLLSDFFNEISEFKIKQTMGVDNNPHRSSVGKFMRHTGGENPLEYEITGKNGEFLGIAQEEKGSSLIPYSIRNHFIGKRRAMVLLIKNQARDIVLCLRRPFYILASTTIIKNYNNQVLGYVWERFDPVNEHYELRSKGKRLMATVKSPIWKWKFPILDSRKKPMGTITQNIPSVGEYMTYRDTLSIKFPGRTLEEKISIMALAFAMFVD